MREECSKAVRQATVQAVHHRLSDSCKKAVVLVRCTCASQFVTHSKEAVAAAKGLNDAG